MTTKPGIQAQIVALSLGALVAFSANSILARLALGGGLADAASYGTIRIASGAIMLVLLVRFGSKRTIGGSWSGAVLLALYAAPFAFAYLQLSAGTGALILFGSVQITMFSSGLRGGERPGRLGWAGFVIALAGLVWFVLPGVDRAPLLPALLMAVAGFAWGGYSLRGRRSAQPLLDTAGNFVRATPLMAALSLATVSSAQLSATGLWYAVLSGAVASAIGYAVWYRALPGLSSTRAATLQLAVPVLTAWAGVLLLNERITLRLALAGTTVLVGVVMATAARLQPPARATAPRQR